LLEHRRGLAQAWYDLARTEKAEGKKQQFEKHLNYCLLLREEILRDYADAPFIYRDDTQWTLERLLALAHLGRHEEAQKEAELLRIKFASKQISYDLARTYALCSLASSADKEAQQRYRGRALDCLEHAVKQGLDQWDDIRYEPDLASLRSDPRFSKILEQEKKEKK
jgi:hypothetical protein